MTCVLDLHDSFPAFKQGIVVQPGVQIYQSAVGIFDGCVVCGLPNK